MCDRHGRGRHRNRRPQLAEQNLASKFIHSSDREGRRSDFVRPKRCTVVSCASVRAARPWSFGLRRDHLPRKVHVGSHRSPHLPSLHTRAGHGFSTLPVSSAEVRYSHQRVICEQANKHCLCLFSNTNNKYLKTMHFLDLHENERFSCKFFPANYGKPSSELREPFQPGTGLFPANYGSDFQPATGISSSRLREFFAASVTVAISP